MFWFLVAVILGAIAVVSIVAAVKAKDNQQNRRGAAGIGVLAALLAAGAGFGCTFIHIDSNTIGMVTQFGKPVGTVGPGPHFLAPWESVDATFSTRVQVSTRNAGPEGDTASADCVKVNLKDAAEGCVDVTVRYLIDEKDAVDLWSRYGSYDAVRDNLVRRATENAAYAVFAAYDPMTASSGVQAVMNAAMTKELAKQLGSSGVKLDSASPVSVGKIHFPADVQNRLNGVLNQNTANQVAQAKIAESKALAEANNALAPSLTLPGMVEQNCINAVQKMAESGHAPAVFNCFPNSSGGGTPLVNVNPGH